MSVSVFEGARPARRGDLVTETQGIAPIPEDQRYGPSWRNFTVWFAPNMELSGVFTGTLAYSLGLGFWPGVCAIVLGVVLGTLPVAYLATWGPKTGMGQLPLARIPFGRSIGVPAAVQWLSAVAWDGLVGLFGGEGAQLLFHVPFFVGALVVLAAQGLFGFLGYEFIHQLQQWGSAVLAVLFVVLTVRVVQHGHVQLHSSVHGAAAVGTFVLMTTIAFSGSFSWASYASDYSRYQSPASASAPIFWWTLGGMGISFVWVYTLGLAGARTFADQTAEGVRRLMGGGVLGGLALLAIIFGAVTSNAMNDYSGSLAVQAGGLRVRRTWTAVAGTILAFFIILWIHGGDTSSKFQNILLFTAYWIAPFLAVILIDWRRRRGTLDHARLAAVMRWSELQAGIPALAALVIGFGAMIPCMNTSLYVGPLARHLDGADLSFYVGFGVSAVVYWLALRLANRRPPRRMDRVASSGMPAR